MASNSEVIPQLSKIVETEGFNQGASSLINLWQHALRSQHTSTGSPGEPKTIVAPDAMRMINLVPQDVAHPLYHNSPSNVALRNEFILDYLFLDSISPDDAKMSSPEGLKVTNMNNKEVVFKKSAGAMTVNDVPVNKQVKLSDGTNVYILESFLFQHKEKVQVAFDELMSQQTNIPFGCPMGPPQ